jgi:hypothetical protein
VPDVLTPEMVPVFVMTLEELPLTDKPVVPVIVP